MVSRGSDSIVIITSKFKIERSISRGALSSEKDNFSTNNSFLKSLTRLCNRLFSDQNDIKSQLKGCTCKCKWLGYTAFFLSVRVKVFLPCMEIIYLLPVKDEEVKGRQCYG